MAHFIRQPRRILLSRFTFGGKPIQFSLRELLAFVLLAALGLGALCVGGFLVSIVATIGFVICIAIAIVAFVGVGRPKTFAIGFLVSLIVWAAAIVLAGEDEMTFHGARLPASTLLTRLYMSSLTLRLRNPDGAAFLMFGNCLFAWIIGLCGGKFAVFVYDLQHQAEKHDPSGAPEPKD